MKRRDDVETYEPSEFDNQIAEQIVNIGRKMTGAEKHITYSPHLIRIALEVWSRSKAAFTHLRSSNTIILPSLGFYIRKRKKE